MTLADLQSLKVKAYKAIGMSDEFIVEVLRKDKEIYERRLRGILV